MCPYFIQLLDDNKYLRQQYLFCQLCLCTAQQNQMTAYQFKNELSQNQEQIVNDQMTRLYNNTSEGNKYNKINNEYSKEGQQINKYNSYQGRVIIDYIEIEGIISPQFKLEVYSNYSKSLTGQTGKLLNILHYFGKNIQGFLIPDLIKIDQETVEEEDKDIFKHTLTFDYDTQFYISAMIPFCKNQPSGYMNVYITK